MSDLNDLSRPVLTDTEPNVLDTLRANIVRAATWAGWGSTANKVAGIMSGITAAVSGGRSLRLYRRNDANTSDEEVVSLPGISVGGNSATASAAQAGSALQTALDAKAPLNSPALTGTPTAPTATVGTASTQIANTAFVATAVANIVNTAPAALDTLNELAAALGNDANFAASTNAALANRVVKTSANRPGVAKLYRNDADDAYNVQINWTGMHWYLRGYLNDTYHGGVRVGYADIAASVQTITTAQVLNATAMGSARGVGTYILASYAEPNQEARFGDVKSGIRLMVSSASGQYFDNYAGSMPGSWMCLGFTAKTFTENAARYAEHTTLWLRIA